MNNLGRNYFEFGRFRFIGRDGSLGYRTGKIYNLYRFPIFNGPRQSVTTKIGCQRTGLQKFLHGDGYCPYDNEDKFFENWERV